MCSYPPCDSDADSNTRAQTLLTISWYYNFLNEQERRLGVILEAAKIPGISTEMKEKIKAYYKGFLGPFDRLKDQEEVLLRKENVHFLRTYVRIESVIPPSPLEDCS